MDEIRDIIEDLDHEFLENLEEDLGIEISNVERYLMNSRLFFGDMAQKNKILDSTNAINLICQQTFLEPLHAYSQILEDFYHEACGERFGHSQWLSELMLLLMDEVRASFEDLTIRRTLDTHLLNELRQQVKSLLVYSGSDVESHIKSVISAFSSRVHPDLLFAAYESEQKEPPVTESEEQMLAEERGPEERASFNEGVRVFEEFSDALDSRSSLWNGRTREVLEYCLLINTYLPNSVDEEQLTAAVFMHDVGMALLPDSFLFKEGMYDSIEVMMLQQHPSQTYGLLRQMPAWKEAAVMVQQHHEHFNGNGYPNGIRGSDIHTGAKIIAIADAFYSLTHNRKDRGFKRSMSRSLAEINRSNGTQFDPGVVEAFNIALIDKARKEVD